METNRKIGTFIARLREERGMTQGHLAKALHTSQSAVARMEKGEQNFSLDTLAKISKVLSREVVSVSSGAMNFRIEGGRKLAGTVRTNTSKNSAVGLLCASLINRGTTTLKNMPRIEEVHRVIEVLRSIGVGVRWIGSDVEIVPPKRFAMGAMNVESARRTRSVLMLLGPLVHHLPKFTIPYPSGCKLGRRTVRPHLYALENFGVKIVAQKGMYHVTAPKLKAPGEVVLYEAGDTVTENALMAAAGIDAVTTIKFASANYMGQDVCRYLEALGIPVDGVGTTTLTVHGRSGVDENVTFYPSEDPIESMMFLALAAVTRSAITIERCPIDFLELELLKLSKMGFRYKVLRRYKAMNGATNLVDIRTAPSKLTALEDKIHAQPFPGINIDNLPFFVPIATQAKGKTLIHDWVYEDRAIYYMDLAKLGANIILADPHRVYVEGPTDLRAAEVVCPPALRPAVIIMIAMLAAKGASVLRNVYSINRGYEDLAVRLKKLGAKIEVF